METKVCTKCGIEKPLTEYNRKTSSSEDRRRPECKSCQAAARHVYWLRNRDRVLAARRPRMRESWRASYARNREARKRAARERYARNRERAAKTSRAWWRANRDRARLYRTERQARKRGALVNDFNVAQWHALVESFGQCCAYCGEQGKLTLDHVVPLSRGGDHTLTNILPACSTCNSRKRDLTALEFLLRNLERGCSS